MAEKFRPSPTPKRQPPTSEPPPQLHPGILELIDILAEQIVDEHYEDQEAG